MSADTLQPDLRRELRRLFDMETHPMKLTIDRDVFAEAVTWTARALAVRPPVPVLAGLLLDADAGTITVSGFDYETSARMTVAAEVGEPGRVLVSGRLLADIVKSLPAKPVTLALDGTRVLLKCGAAKFTLLTMPVDEYPDIPVVPESSGVIPAEVFTRAVGQVAVAASRDETLPILTGVRVELGADTVTLLATDRYRLAMRVLPWTTDPRTSGTVPAVLIRSRTLADVAKSLIPGTDLQVGFGDSHAGFQAGQRRTTSLLVDGEYPKVRALFPAAADAVAVVETDALVQAVKRVAPRRGTVHPGQAQVHARHGGVGGGAGGGRAGPGNLGRHVRRVGAVPGVVQPAVPVGRPDRSRDRVRPVLVHCGRETGGDHRPGGRGGGRRDRLQVPDHAGAAVSDISDLRGELRRLSKAWARAKTRERAIAAEIAEKVRAAEGSIPETELAEIVHANRGTVRGWLGKKRIRRH